MKGKDKKAFKVGSVIVTILLGVVTFVCLNYVAQKTNGSYEKADIVVSVKEVPENTKITKSNVSTYFKVAKNIDADMCTSDSVTSLDELVGMYACRDIHNREIILKSNFENEKDKKSEYENPDEVSFKVSSFSDAVSGTIRKGDVINIYTLEDTTAAVQTEAQSEAQLVFENAYVADAFDDSGVKIVAGDNVAVATNFIVYMEKSNEASFYQAIKDKKVIVTKVQ